MQRPAVVVAPLLAGGRRGRWANRSGGPRTAEESLPPERTKRERAAGAHRYGEEVHPRIRICSFKSEVYWREVGLTPGNPELRDGGRSRITSL